MSRDVFAEEVQIKRDIEKARQKVDSSDATTEFKPWNEE